MVFLGKKQAKNTVLFPWSHNNEYFYINIVSKDCEIWEVTLVATNSYQLFLQLHSDHDSVLRYYFSVAFKACSATLKWQIIYLFSFRIFLLWKNYSKLILNWK